MSRTNKSNPPVSTDDAGNEFLRSIDTAYNDVAQLAASHTSMSTTAAYLEGTIRSATDAFVKLFAGEGNDEKMREHVTQLANHTIASVRAITKEDHTHDHHDSMQRFADAQEHDVDANEAYDQLFTLMMRKTRTDDPETTQELPDMRLFMMDLNALTPRPNDNIPHNKRIARTDYRVAADSGDFDAVEAITRVEMDLLEKRVIAERDQRVRDQLQTEIENQQSIPRKRITKKESRRDLQGDDKSVFKDKRQYLDWFRDRPSPFQQFSVNGENVVTVASKAHELQQHHHTLAAGDLQQRAQKETETMERLMERVRQLTLVPNTSGAETMHTGMKAVQMIAPQSTDEPFTAVTAQEIKQKLELATEFAATWKRGWNGGLQEFISKMWDYMTGYEQRAIWKSLEDLRDDISEQGRELAEMIEKKKEDTTIVRAKLVLQQLQATIRRQYGSRTSSQIINDSMIRIYSEQLEMYLEMLSNNRYAAIVQFHELFIANAEVNVNAALNARDRDVQIGVKKASLPEEKLPTICNAVAIDAESNEVFEIDADAPRLLGLPKDGGDQPAPVDNPPDLVELCSIEDEAVREQATCRYTRLQDVDLWRSGFRGTLPPWDVLELLKSERVSERKKISMHGKIRLYAQSIGSLYVNGNGRRVYEEGVIEETAKVFNIATGTTTREQTYRGYTFTRNLERIYKAFFDERKPSGIDYIDPESIDRRLQAIQDEEVFFGDIRKGDDAINLPLDQTDPSPARRSLDYALRLYNEAFIRASREQHLVEAFQLGPVLTGMVLRDQLTDDLSLVYRLNNQTLADTPVEQEVHSMLIQQAEPIMKMIHTVLTAEEVTGAFATEQKLRAAVERSARGHDSRLVLTREYDGGMFGLAGKTVRLTRFRAPTRTLEEQEEYDKIVANLSDGAKPYKTFCVVENAPSGDTSVMPIIADRCVDVKTDARSRMMRINLETATVTTMSVITAATSLIDETEIEVTSYPTSSEHDPVARPVLQLPNYNSELDQTDRFFAVVRDELLADASPAFDAEIDEQIRGEQMQQAAAAMQAKREEASKSWFNFMASDDVNAPQQSAPPSDTSRMLWNSWFSNIAMILLVLKFLSKILYLALYARDNFQTERRTAIVKSCKRACISVRQRFLRITGYASIVPVMEALPAQKTPPGVWQTVANVWNTTTTALVGDQLTSVREVIVDATSESLSDLRSEMGQKASGHWVGLTQKLRGVQESVQQNLSQFVTLITAASERLSVVASPKVVDAVTMLVVLGAMPAVFQVGLQSFLMTTAFAYYSNVFQLVSVQELRRTTEYVLQQRLADREQSAALAKLIFFAGTAGQTVASYLTSREMPITDFISTAATGVIKLVPDVAKVPFIAAANFSFLALQAVTPIDFVWNAPNYVQSGAGQPSHEAVFLATLAGQTVGLVIFNYFRRERERRRQIQIRERLPDRYRLSGESLFQSVWQLILPDQTLKVFQPKDKALKNVVAFVNSRRGISSSSLAANAGTSSEDDESRQQQIRPRYAASATKNLQHSNAGTALQSFRQVSNTSSSSSTSSSFNDYEPSRTNRSTAPPPSVINVNVPSFAPQNAEAAKKKKEDAKETALQLMENSLKAKFEYADGKFSLLPNAATNNGVYEIANGIKRIIEVWMSKYSDAEREQLLSLDIVSLFRTMVTTLTTKNESFVCTAATQKVTVIAVPNTAKTTYEGFATWAFDNRDQLTALY